MCRPTSQEAPAWACSLCHAAVAVRSCRGVDLVAARQLPGADPPANVYPSGGPWEVLGGTTGAVGAVSRLFKYFAIDTLCQCDVIGATRSCGSAGAGVGGMQWAVTRDRTYKQARIVRRIGIEENAAAKGHRYLMSACDIGECLWEHIAARYRMQESLNGNDEELTQG